MVEKFYVTYNQVSTNACRNILPRVLAAQEHSLKSFATGPQAVSGGCAKDPQ